MKFLLCLLLVSACHPRPIINAPVKRPGYQYVRVSGDIYAVLAFSDEEFAKAKREIGCGPCSEQFDGKVWHVQVLK